MAMQRNYSERNLDIDRSQGSNRSLSNDRTKDSGRIDCCIAFRPANWTCNNNGYTMWWVNFNRLLVLFVINPRHFTICP